MLFCPIFEAPTEQSRKERKVPLGTLQANFPALARCKNMSTKRMRESANVLSLMKVRSTKSGVVLHAV